MINLHELNECQFVRLELSDALEPVVVGLVGDLEGAGVAVRPVAAAETDGLDGVVALVILNLSALLDSGGGRTGRVGRGCALTPVTCHLHLVELESVEYGGGILALPDKDCYGVGHLLQVAIQSQIPQTPGWRTQT